jgi:hypothetical protein
MEDTYLTMSPMSFGLGSIDARSSSVLLSLSRRLE